MTDNQLRVVVTGASGFVGSHALEALADIPGVEVIPACRDAGKLPEPCRAAACVGDLNDAPYRQRLLRGTDVLVNAAAWTSAWGHADASRRHFLEPALALYADAAELGVRRIINISSTSVAAPDKSADPMQPGIQRGRWPHLDNVIAIENFLRQSIAPTVSVVNLRLGLFVGERYAIGLLPILLPRLKTHLVPWVSGGRTSMPLVDGRDIAQAVARAVMAEGLSGFESFNIVGPSVPMAREVIEYLHREYGYPKPHFNVPFPVAYRFARLMEWLDSFVPWEPLVTRSIIHLLEEVAVDNHRAEAVLGYRPRYRWQTSVQRQMEEMAERQSHPMSLVKPLP